VVSRLFSHNLPTKSGLATTEQAALFSNRLAGESLGEKFITGAALKTRRGSIGLRKMY
jgi:hypothetical protein